MRRRLLALVSVLALALAMASPVAAHWPVHSRYSRVSQWYHRSHPAIDIAAGRGAHIFSMGTGRVVFAGWKRNCGGWQVWIRMTNGRYTTFAHMLRRPRVHRGQHVTIRTMLGYVGRSGIPPRGVRMVCATGYHTHVEVWTHYPWRHGSRRLNPWSWMDHGPWLPRRYR